MKNHRQCAACNEQLIEIDHYGERLTGCIECNTWRSDKRAFVVELTVENIQALRGLATNGRKARSVR